MSIIQIKPWDLIERFCEHCDKIKGWHTYKAEGLVQIKESFHEFIWAHNPVTETFKSVILNSSCVIPNSQEFFETFDFVERDVSYRFPFKMVRVSFIAWVLSAGPSKGILDFVRKRPQIQRWVALYDLDRFFKSGSDCKRLNKTESEVFKEFER